LRKIRGLSIKNTLIYNGKQHLLKAEVDINRLKVRKTNFIKCLRRKNKKLLTAAVYINVPYYPRDDKVVFEYNCVSQSYGIAFVLPFTPCKYRKKNGFRYLSAYSSKVGYILLSNKPKKC